MSTTQSASTTPARKSEPNLLKLREQAAKKSTERVAAILASHRPVRLDALIEAVALDAADKGLASLPDSEIQKLGGAVVKTGLLAHYSAAKYGDGAWISKVAGKKIRAAFEAAKS